MVPGSSHRASAPGFTLIELVMVIVILGVVAAVALPRFSDLSGSARIAALDGIAGSMRSVIAIVRSKARAQGLSVAATNPGGGAAQSVFIVDTEAGSAEVDWRNLCPESVAELGDRLSMPDFIDLSTSAGLTSTVTNRYTFIGYAIPGAAPTTAAGCYVIYDSFGNPDCTVSVVTVDC